MKNRRVLYLAQAAVTAALYVALTILANALGLASGNIQIRFSEALSILPVYTPAAVPGLFAGCLLANIVTGCALPDVIFGSLATLLGALGTRLLRRQSRFLAPLPPILANTLIVPFVLKYAYGIGPLWLSFLAVGIGETLSCGVMGSLLYSALFRFRRQLSGGGDMTV